MAQTQTREASAPQGPLAGVKVLDLSNFLAGPLATMYLADFGADVIKVEAPGRGDEIRMWGRRKNGVGLYWKMIARGKRSITLDLRKPLGQAIARRLAAEADVLVENFRPGTFEKWGLGWTELERVNPRLIMLRVTGFGQTGPYAHRPGFGTLAEAYAGAAAITGYPDRPPLLPAFGLADNTAGIFGAFAIMLALYQRDLRGGTGQVIDLPIYEPLFTLLGPQVVDYDRLGVVQKRAGSRLPFTAPRNTYRTRDDQWVAIGGSAQSIFERILAALDIPHVARDPRFIDNQLRVQNVEALDEIIQKEVEKYTLEEVLRRFDAHGAAVAPANTIAQIFRDPHIQARGNIATVPDPELGEIRMQNIVPRLLGTPGRIRHAGPRLGEHNREILIEQLGYSEEQLRAEGMI